MPLAMKIQLILPILTAALALTTQTSAVPVNGLQPYNAEGFNLSLSTISGIEELVKQEFFTNLYMHYVGLSPDYPASSCKDLAELRPDYSSGYYWVAGVAGPTGVHCEIDATSSSFGEDGGWMRIALVDMTDGRMECPRGLDYVKIDGRALCQRPLNDARSCSSSMFAVHGIQYSKLCGKVIGYQYSEPNGFGPTRFGQNINLDSFYVDGVSISHGDPRQHIWSLAAASTDGADQDGTACPCIDPDAFSGTIPSFVGNDFYCETGNREETEQKYYFDDPLWDGQGCAESSSCCESGAPWFCTELDTSTTDDVEIRICLNQPNQDVVLKEIVFYVQ